jgi:hypothetical protein
MDYNSVLNRIATVGYSNEPEFCKNNSTSCNFIIMYAYDNMEV